MKVKCTVCGKEFEAERGTAKYCGDPCKLKFNRNKKVSVSPVSDDTVREPIRHVKLTDADKYVHLMFEECDGKNCPGGFKPGWKTMNLRSVREALDKLRK